MKRSQQSPKTLRELYDRFASPPMAREYPLGIRSPISVGVQRRTRRGRRRRRRRRSRRRQRQTSSLTARPSPETLNTAIVVETVGPAGEGVESFRDRPRGDAVKIAVDDCDDVAENDDNDSGDDDVDDDDDTKGHRS